MIRQHTGSGWFIDEAEFEPELEEALGAAQPVLKGGGRLEIVSSAEPGYFEQLAEDRIRRGGVFRARLILALAAGHSYESVAGDLLTSAPTNCHFEDNFASRVDDWRQAPEFSRSRAEP